MSNLTIMGSTDNRDDVIIEGLGWNNNSVTHIFNIAADNVTIANMTIGNVFYHPIQVHSNPSDADNFLLQNVRVIDAKEQLLKVSGGGELKADNGIVQCCLFEFTEGIAYQWYTGGIDAHRSKDWIVRQNTFKGIRSPESNLAEHAIHFWRESEGTIVEGNQIISCDRGIGFGLGDQEESGHLGGLIMNNFVHTNRDVGIGLEHSPSTKIYNNTVITENYNRSIEYRFESTRNVEIVNNLVDQEISDRSSGSSGTLLTNLSIDNYDVFLSNHTYDYHLHPDAINILDQGTPLNEVTIDFDCDLRNNPFAYDIGADELFLSNIKNSFINTQVYPNPTSDELFIRSDNKKVNLELFDLSGRTIPITGFPIANISNGTHRIDLSFLPEGLYILHILDKGSGSLHQEKVLKTQ